MFKIWYNKDITLVKTHKPNGESIFIEFKIINMYNYIYKMGAFY